MHYHDLLLKLQKIICTSRRYKTKKIIFDKQTITLTSIFYFIQKLIVYTNLLHDSNGVMTSFTSLMCFNYDCFILICLCGLQDRTSCCLLYRHDPPIGLEDIRESNTNTTLVLFVESKMCIILSYIYFNHHINYHQVSWA